MLPSTTIDLTWKTLLKLTIIPVGLWFLWKIRNILALLFIVLVIVAALSPVVDRWSKRLPRWLAVALVFLLILLFAVGIVLLIVPPLVFEIRRLAAELPTLAETFTPSFINDLRSNLTDNQQLVDQVSTGLSQLANSLYTATRGLFGGLVSLVTMLVMVFYLLLEHRGATKLLNQHLPIEQSQTVVAVLQKIGLKMGNWLRGQTVIALIMGLATWIVLTLIGVPYSVTLAVLTGLLDFIPIIGPLIALIPVVLLALTISPLTAGLAVVLITILQQLENHILVPKIIGKSLGLSPVLIIIAILIGAQLSGIFGVIIALPTAAVIAVLIKEWPHLKRALGKI